MRWIADTDPEPVVVVIGADGWLRHGRVADVIIVAAQHLSEARRACAGLLDDQRGPSLVVSPLPDGRMVVGVRGAGPLVLPAGASLGEVADRYFGGADDGGHTHRARAATVDRLSGSAM